MQLNDCFTWLNHYLTIAKSHLAIKEVTESENQMKYFLTALLISVAMIKIQVYYQELLNSCPTRMTLQKNQ